MISKLLDIIIIPYNFVHLLYAKYGWYIFDAKKIPEGSYCYSIKETPSIFNGFVLKVNRCPYYKYLGKNTCGCTVCGEIEHYGYLLWDSVKICGINE